MIENLAAKLCLLLSENANAGKCREIVNLLNGKSAIGVYQSLSVWLICIKIVHIRVYTKIIA